MKNQAELMRDKFYLFVIAAFCILMMVLSVGLSELLIQRDMDHENSLMKDSILSTGVLIAQEIQRKVTQGIFATETLHALLESNNYSPDNFDSWGYNIVHSNSIASTVQLAPDGVVRYIYPLQGNEGAVGHDLLEDKRRDKGAMKALQSKEITFIGPVKLIQNGKYAVIARDPIFINENGKEKFWGFTIALLLVEDILPEITKNLVDQGIFLKLEGDDPDSPENPVFYQSPKWNDQNAISFLIKVPNGEWRLNLSHAKIKNSVYHTIRTASFVAALTLFSFLFFQQYRMRKRQREIFQLNEILTEDIRQREIAEKEKERLISELKEALNNVKVLSGLVPICAKCKKIRDDDGYWNKLETFIENHSDILFSHGLCQDCSDEMYGDQAWYRKMKKKQEEKRQKQDKEPE